MKQADYKQKCLDIYYACDVVNKELSFGCEVQQLLWAKPAIFLRKTRGGRFAYIRPEHMELKEKWEDSIKVIGHPPTGFDWLRLIDSELAGNYTFSSGNGVIYSIMNELDIKFNLTTGEPTDWEALYKIIS